jgi:excisionase family DNA binding protein
MGKIVSTSSLESKDTLGIGKAAKFLGVSIDTLRRWSKKGKIKSYRSPGGHRYFLKKDLTNVQNQKYAREKPKIVKAEKKIIKSSSKTFLSYKHEIISQLLPAIKIILIALAVILILNFIVIDIILLSSFFR